jgi:hypothetical protein
LDCEETVTAWRAAEELIGSIGFPHIFQGAGKIDRATGGFARK